MHDGHAGRGGGAGCGKAVVAGVGVPMKEDKRELNHSQVHSAMPKAKNAGKSQVSRLFTKGK